jgi:hypothetical protein
MKVVSLYPRGLAVMQFLKKLFGGAPTAAAADAPAMEHKGFRIRATPYQDKGQWQMCGVIEKDIDGVSKSHRFVRADRFAAEAEAAEFTLAKARQIIDQLGDAVFDKL